MCSVVDILRRLSLSISDFVSCCAFLISIVTIFITKRLNSIKIISNSFESKSIFGYDPNPIAIVVHDNYHGLYHHFGYSIPSNYLICRVCNIGKITAYCNKIKVYLKVYIDEFLREHRITGGKEQWQIDVNEVIKPGEELIFTLSEISCYPKAKMMWKIQFEEMSNRILRKKSIKNHYCINNRNSMYNQEYLIKNSRRRFLKKIYFFLKELLK